MDDQLIPGAGAAGVAPACPPAAAPAAPLRKAPTVLAGLSALDQAVPTVSVAGAPSGGARAAPLPPHMFLPLHMQHMAAAGMHMPMPPHFAMHMGMNMAMNMGVPGMNLGMNLGLPGMNMGLPRMNMGVGMGMGMPNVPGGVGGCLPQQQASSTTAAAAAATAAAAAVMEEQQRAGNAQDSAATSAASATQSVGTKRPAPLTSEASPESAPPPAQKPRWETPLRVGTWSESWDSATALAEGAPTATSDHAAISRVVRGTLAEIIISYVGEQLPRATVEKWLCLLSEYLELNADEQILVVCLLRRFVDSGGKFVGDGDHLRPQTWERVVAIACYLSVLLSEEFPGRAASDLRELLGPNFRFGVEQMIFLKTVDWRISISHEAFVEVKAAVAADDRETLVGWFKTADAAAIRKERAEEAAKEAKTAIAELAAKAAAAKAAAATASMVPPKNLATLGAKKRDAVDIAAEDGVVPGATDFAGPWSATQWTY